MKEDSTGLHFSRRKALKTLGSVAGAATFSGLASAAKPEVVRTINVDTSKHDRVDDAKVKFYSDGALEHTMSGHQPEGASATNFTIKMSNGNMPDHAEATLVQKQPTNLPNTSGENRGQATNSGSQDDIGTMGHSGGNSESDYYGWVEMVCEKGDRCTCWAEKEVTNHQDAEWSDDDGDGCVSDAENYWTSGWAIYSGACEDWSHDSKQQWEDDNPCSLDQIREDRFSYAGGSNSIVMRQQMTLHADGSNDWEVTRYDDGGNGCLFHGVNVK